MVTYIFSFFFNLVEKKFGELKAFLSVAKMASLDYERENPPRRVFMLFGYLTYLSCIVKHSVTKRDKQLWDEL